MDEYDIVIDRAKKEYGIDDLVITYKPHKHGEVWGRQHEFASGPFRCGLFIDESLEGDRLIDALMVGPLAIDMSRRRKAKKEGSDVQPNQ
jgi:hypothetical protein